MRVESIDALKRAIEKMKDAEDDLTIIWSLENDGDLLRIASDGKKSLIDARFGILREFEKEGIRL